VYQPSFWRAVFPQSRKLDGGNVVISGTGIIKWFDSIKGFGFITPAIGGLDIFIHASELRKSGIDKVNEGDKVSFEVKKGPKGSAATNISLTSTQDV
jgi:CspA family cold shock protein